MAGRDIRRLILAAAFAVGALAAGPGAAQSPGDAPRLQPGQPMPPAELEAMVDGVVRQAMDQDHIAGVTVSVVQDGQVVLKKGYGFADVDRGRRVDPDQTLFRMGSITKTFTWIMALEAANEGKLSLDAPINGYLPAKLRIPDEGFRQQIRMRDLMTHTPGFEELVLGGLFIRDPARLQPAEDYLAAHRPARIWSPGEVSAYSNYGAALAGIAVGHVQGAPWPDLLEQRILQPAGMTHTTGREPYPPRPKLDAPMPSELMQNLSLPYRWAGTRFRAEPFEYVAAFSPAGSISSTAGDMARYMNLLLGGGVLDGRTVYSPATAAAIRTPMRAFPGGAAVDAGFFQVPMPGGFISYGHNGATLDFSSNMTVVPQLRLGIFVGANTESGQRLTGRLGWDVIQRFYGPPKSPPHPSRELLQDAAVYSGEFISTRRPFHGLQAFVMGLRAAPVSVAAPGYLTVGGERFTPTDEPRTFRNVDNPALQISAVVENGRATKLIATAGELWRRDWVHQARTLTLVGGAAVLAAIAVLAGLFSPARWQAPQTPVQRVAGSLRGPAAALWIVAVGAFAVTMVRALRDTSTVVYDWPGPLMLTASSAGLAAAVLSWGAAALTPFALAGAEGWGVWRKVRFTLTVTAFAAFGLLLAVLGALQPWNP